MKNKLFVFTSVIGLSLLFSGCTITIGNAESEKPAPAPTTQTTPPTQPTAPQPNTEGPSVDDPTRTLGNVTITLEAIRDEPGNEISPPQNGTFLLIKATVTNNEEYPIGIGETSVKLTDENGLTVDGTHNPITVKDTSFFAETIPSKGTLTAVMIFDTSKSSFYDLNYTLSEIYHQSTTWRIKR